MIQDQYLLPKKPDRNAINKYTALQHKIFGIISTVLNPLSLFKFFALFPALLLVILMLGSDAIPN